MKPFLEEPDLLKLLDACHQRTAAAQQRLYREYYPFAYNIARHYADNESAAEDIVQDAFIKLFRHLEADAFRGNFAKFFRRIIVNTGIDHYRARAIRRRLIDRLSDRLRPNTENDAPGRLEAQDVYRFLQQLSPGYRLVFNLYVLEGFSHPEIAQRLGISVGTSKSNLAKARRRLRGLAEPYFQTKK